MTQEFVRIKAVASHADLHVKSIDGYDEDYLLRDPQPLAQGFPSDASFTLRKPTKKPEDLVPNHHSVLLCSPALKDFLLKEGGLGDVEVLDVTIHAKKPMPYHIVRPLDRLELINLEDERVEFNSLDPEAILTPIWQLELDFTKVPATTQLFIPKHHDSTYLARADFAQELAARFKGIYIKPLDEPYG